MVSATAVKQTVKTSESAADKCAAITLANQVNSPLLRLSAELRDRIYALTSDTVHIHRASHPFDAELTYNGSVLGQVCKQTLSEAAPYIESPGILSLPDDVSSRQFFTLLNKGHLKHPARIHTFELETSHGYSVRCVVIGWNEYEEELFEVGYVYRGRESISGVVRTVFGQSGLVVDFGKG
ncbi:hypothetical protein E8E11_002293 [Didymella keratinophila]|nr:hypothetical protein E8E11_002293 [Didymella keratinophila]